MSDAGLARRACRSLIACESSTRQLGVRSGGAAHDHLEAPRSFDSASRRRHFERSRGSLLQNVHRLMWGSTRTSFFLGAYTLILAVQ